MEIEFCLPIFEKFSNIIFQEYRSSESQLGRTDGQT